VTALGRKNYLFAGSDDGGRRAALYTLIETAKMNGVDPEAWLRDVLARLLTPPSASSSCCLGSGQLSASRAKPPPETSSPLSYPGALTDAHRTLTQICSHHLVKPRPAVLVPGHKSGEEAWPMRWTAPAPKEHGKSY
jgi:hypothetical protein